VIKAGKTFNAEPSRLGIFRFQEFHRTQNNHVADLKPERRQCVLRLREQPDGMPSTAIFRELAFAATQRMGPPALAMVSVRSEAS